MTAAEYQRLYRTARESWPRLTRDAMRGMQRVYDKAVEMVASVIRQAEQRGLAEITQASWAQIETQLEAGARLIREALERQATRAITTGTERITGIDAKYLIDVSSLTGGKITATGVRNMYAAVNQTLISTLASRIYQGKYSFSERVWRVGWGYSAKIKDLVGSGLAANMDVRDIARVIESYVKKGARATTTRYGDLIGRAFRRRMGVDVSYPALRLVRSELYASMQQTALWAGLVNPGALDLYDWIRSTHEDWGCACPELAENSPYTYQNAPSYPHPNCHPAGTMIMTEHGEMPIEKIKPGMFVYGIRGALNQVSAKWTTLYSGEIIKADGLEMTPEHLLFTDRGWIAAHFLKNGDNLIGISRNVKSFSFIKTIADNTPTGLDKSGSFFRIILFLTRSGVPIPAIDFDGQLYFFKREINIEYPDGKIWERLFTASDQGIIQHAFVGRPDLTGIELRYGGSVFERLCPTPDGIMCGASVCLPAVRIAPDVSFVDSRKFESKLKKVSVNTIPTDTEQFSYLVYREIFVSEQMNESFFIDNIPSTHNSAIVSVVRKKVNNIPVYNLTVNNDHTFFANGIASHNCLCRLVPRLMDRREFVDDLARWSRGEPVEYLDNWKASYYDQLS